MTINCPKCKASLKLPETAVGRMVRCPKCQERFAAPSAPVEASPIELTDPAPEESPLEQMAAAAQGSSRNLRPQYAAPPQQPQYQPPPQQQFAPQATPGVLRCPKCGSTQISANQKGFGAGKACLGFLLGCGILAPLCGFLGAKKMLITCLACGYQWKAGKG
ncbi:MAG: hypothetical protein BWX88_05034 [Planctomycetes bacterium ADurb.Bin126]|nr:MAG: hypothetical protein BWX88_05034 [Planctomycetes bacterium ADurb.Bin126]